MWSGLVLYGTEQLNALDAYRLANNVFKILNIQPKDCSHYQANKKNDDITLVKSKLNSVESDLQQGIYKDFYLSDSSSRKDDGDISFIYNEQYGRFHGIILLTCLNEKCLINLDNIIHDICKNTQIEYGIFYSIDDEFDAISYFDGADFVNLYSYENSSLFDEDLAMHDGEEEPLYKAHKLRMVYTCNVLNKNHLTLKIGDQSLKDFIAISDENGRIEQINDYQYIWKVDEEYIDQLNKVLGEAGILISYELPKPKAINKPRLP